MKASKKQTPGADSIRHQNTTTEQKAPTTANNRQVIESVRIQNGWLVLCVGWNDVTPYVSWIVYDNGCIEHGEYVRTIHDASSMWRERCKKWGV